MDEITTLNAPHRMKVRLGDHAFVVSGREHLVNEQFDRFVEAAIAIAQANCGSSKSSPKANGSSRETPANEDGGAAVESNWDRAFKRKDNQLSLNVLPSTKNQKSDALVLIMYGYQALLSYESVPCTEMMDAAKVSGLRIDRVDRALPAAYRGYYHKGGSAKGTRYTLNNQGLRYAQELLEQMFDA